MSFFDKVKAGWATFEQPDHTTRHRQEDKFIAKNARTNLWRGRGLYLGELVNERGNSGEDSGGVSLTDTAGLSYIGWSGL